MIAGLIAVTPLYAVSLVMSYTLTRLTTTVLYGQSPGTYDHYFATFLVPRDIRPARPVRPAREHFTPGQHALFHRRYGEFVTTYGYS